MPAVETAIISQLHNLPQIIFVWLWIGQIDTLISYYRTTVNNLKHPGSISKDEIRKVYESIYSLVSNSEYFKDEVTEITIEERVEKIFSLMDTVGHQFLAWLFITNVALTLAKINIEIIQGR